MRPLSRFFHKLREFGRSATVADPDGNVVILMEPPRLQKPDSAPLKGPQPRGFAAISL
jgi:hypothetical protein